MTKNKGRLDMTDIAQKEKDERIAKGIGRAARKSVEDMFNASKTKEAAIKMEIIHEPKKGFVLTNDGNTVGYFRFKEWRLTLYPHVTVYLEVYDEDIADDII